MSDRDWQVEEVRWREEDAGVFGVRRGFEAKVRWPDRALWVSRLEGEDGWVADALYGPDRRGNPEVPIFVHGFGSRATIPRVVVDPELVAELDRRATEAAREAGR